MGEVKTEKLTDGIVKDEATLLEDKRRASKDENSQEGVEAFAEKDDTIEQKIQNKDEKVISDDSKDESEPKGLKEESSADVQNKGHSSEVKVDSKEQDIQSKAENQIMMEEYEIKESSAEDVGVKDVIGDEKEMEKEVGVEIKQSEELSSNKQILEGDKKECEVKESSKEEKSSSD